MTINHVTDRVDETLQISPMKTKRQQTYNYNSREILPAELEETGSISDSDEDSDEDQLELTPRQLSHLVLLIKEGTLKQNSTQRKMKVKKQMF